MKKMIFLGFFVIAGFIASPLSQAQNITQQQQFKTTSGRVAALDGAAGLLTVDTGEEEMTFVVLGDAVIVKGTQGIPLTDINVNDSVMVEYCDNCFAGLKAIRISVRTAED